MNNNSKVLRPSVAFWIAAGLLLSAFNVFAATFDSPGGSLKPFLAGEGKIELAQLEGSAVVVESTPDWTGAGLNLAYDRAAYESQYSLWERQWQEPPDKIRAGTCRVESRAGGDVVWERSVERKDHPGLTYRIMKLDFGRDCYFYFLFVKDSVVKARSRYRFGKEQGGAYWLIGPFEYEEIRFDDVYTVAGFPKSYAADSRHEKIFEFPSGLKAAERYELGHWAWRVAKTDVRFFMHLDGYERNLQRFRRRIERQ